MVCHSTGALRHVKTTDGKPLVEGKTVTGFTNGEENEAELAKVVPFLVEDEVMRLGATFSKVKNWNVNTVADRQLITGQIRRRRALPPDFDRYAEQEAEIVRPTEPGRRRHARLPEILARTEADKNNSDNRAEAALKIQAAAKRSTTRWMAASAR